MSEFEQIREIVEGKIYNNTYSAQELDMFSIVFSSLYQIHNDFKKIPLLKNNLDFLLSEEIITSKEFIDLKAAITAINYTNLPEDTVIRIKNILSRIEDKLQDINNNLVNNDVKKLYEKMQDNIKNLNSDEFKLLLELIKNDNCSFMEKRRLLIYISLQVAVFNDEYKEDYEEIDNFDKGMTEEECIALFDKYGYSFKNDFTKKHQDLLMKTGNYDQIDKILLLLKEKNINLHKCNDIDLLKINKRKDDLVIIFTKSNANCVSRIIEFGKKYNLYDSSGNIDFATLSETPSKFILRKRKYKPRFVKNISGGEDKNYTAANHQDFFKNVEFFEKMCERVHGNGINFISNLYRKCHASLLEAYQYDRILEVEKILKLYGLTEKDYFDCATSVFNAVPHAEILDLIIELDLMDYLKENPSIFSLYNRKGQKDLLYVASTNKNQFMHLTKNHDFVGQEKEKRVLSVVKIKNVILDNPSIIPLKAIDNPIDKKNNKTFDEIVKSEPIDFEYVKKEIENSDSTNVIKVLEDNFRDSEDEYIYLIAGIRISRLKVLRVYNIFIKREQKFKDLKIDEDAQLRYAIARNSYISNEELNKIIEEIKKYQKGREI